MSHSYDTLWNSWLWYFHNFITVIAVMCEWLNFGTFFKFPCIVRIYAWFFMHCRNHHSDSHANYVIIIITTWLAVIRYKTKQIWSSLISSTITGAKCTQLTFQNIFQLNIFAFTFCVDLVPLESLWRHKGVVMHVTRITMHTFPIMHNSPSSASEFRLQISVFICIKTN